MNKEEIIARIHELKSERDEYRSARDRLQEFIDTPDWGQIDIGKSIAKDDVVRFGIVRYRAKSAHTKSVTRSPLNPLYWDLEA